MRTPYVTARVTFATTTLNASAIGDGSVDNTELSYLDGVTSNIQDQLGTGTGGVQGPQGPPGPPGANGADG